MAVVPLDGVKSGMYKSQPWNIVLASLLFHFHAWGEKRVPHHKKLQQTSLIGLGRENNTKIMTLLPPPPLHLPPFLFSLPSLSPVSELRGFFRHSNELFL